MSKKVKKAINYVLPDPQFEYEVWKCPVDRMLDVITKLGIKKQGYTFRASSIPQQGSYVTRLLEMVVGLEDEVTYLKKEVELLRGKNHG